MGFSLRKLWEQIKGSPTTDLLFLPDLQAALPWIGEPIVPDECYVELYVESLRLREARKFATTFHGVVYTFASLAREGEPTATVAALTKPEKLATLDSGSLSDVITVSKKMMGAIPWRGGELQLELGLFSVRSGNLITPMLDFVTKVSSTAGISFVGQITPFVPLITQGMEMLAGQRQDTAIEVAFDGALKLEKTGLFAIVDAPKGRYDPESISLDQADMKLNHGGNALEEAYCVFSIRQTKQKADYGEIPVLRDRYAAVLDAIRSRDMRRTRKALDVFVAEVVVSPDLIASDADALIAKAEERVRRAFPAGGMSVAEAPEDDGETLASLRIYG